MSDYKRFTSRDWRNCPKMEQDRMSNYSAELFNILFEQLATLEDKIEQGELVELPCKLNDTIYWVNNYRPTPRIEEYIINGISYSENGVFLYIKNTFKGIKLNENIFLTKEQAEARLAELKGAK